MNENFEQKYGYLWETPGHYWVLLKDPELQGEFAVFNKRGSVLLIESEEEHAEDVERRAHGDEHAENGESSSVMPRRVENRVFAEEAAEREHAGERQRGEQEAQVGRAHALVQAADVVDVRGGLVQGVGDVARAQEQRGLEEAVHDEMKQRRRDLAEA